MRYPANLPENGTIGFIAPSFACTTEPYRSCFERALPILEESGFKEKLGPNCWSDNGIGISNTPEACGEEVNQFFTDPEVDAIISCGGGELMNTILDHVDFDLLRKAPPKWFMGFSDNTNLTFLLATLCDTASIYGPNIYSFGMEPWHPVLTDAMELLMGDRDTINSYGSWEIESLKDEENPFEPYNTTEPSILVPWPEDMGDVSLSGRLLGGCLDVLNMLGGTCYDKVPEFLERYKEDGVLWFFESCDLNVMDITRALWHLEHCGWFANAKGFVFGRPLHFGEELMGLDQYDAVINVLGKYEVPILMDADLGHLPPSMPMMVGAYTELFRHENELTFKFYKR
ncbi:MAG: LD-carboxypeptidase [Stomatobaculum sp.]|nr:LD-carboxypeptidase [Stomatobaculum sp.]